jgi:hypothetical protein
MKLALPNSDDSDDEIVSDDSYILEDDHLSCSDHDSNSEITAEDTFDQSREANNTVNIRRSAARMGKKKNPSLRSDKLQKQKNCRYCPYNKNRMTS